MAVDHVKSTPVTNLDASPMVSNTAGEGAAGVVEYDRPSNRIRIDLACVSRGESPPRVLCFEEEATGQHAAGVDGEERIRRLPGNQARGVEEKAPRSCDRCRGLPVELLHHFSTLVEKQ